MSHSAVGRPMEILLVEDNLVDARLTIEALRKGQVAHRLTLVVDGEEATEFLQRAGRFARAPRPDLILLDMQLPKKHGRQLLSEIRSSDELKDIPVAVITISEAEQDVLQSELLGVAAYITKPMNLEKFLSVVKTLKNVLRDDVQIPPDEKDV